MQNKVLLRFEQFQGMVFQLVLPLNNLIIKYHLKK